MRTITTAGAASRPTEWPVRRTLETYARGELQQVVPRLLEQEVDALLGRKKSERRTEASTPGYRHGHGRPRQFALSSGPLTAQRPRVSDMDAQVASRLLPLFKRRTDEVGALLPERYLHGRSLGDFAFALRGLLGDAAPLSPSSI